MANTIYENIIDITLLGKFKRLLETVMDEKDAAAIAASGKASFQKVDAIPTAEQAQDNILYLVMNSETEHYDIYAKVDNEVVLLDDTTVNLTNYVEKVTGKGLSTNDYTTEEKTKLADIDDSADVNVIESVKVNGTSLTPDGNKAVDVTVPTAVSDLTNDSGFQTAAQVDGAIDAKISLATSAQIQAMFTNAE